MSPNAKPDAAVRDGVVCTVAGPRRPISTAPYLGAELQRLSTRPGAYEALDKPSLINGRPHAPGPWVTLHSGRAIEPASSDTDSDSGSTPSAHRAPGPIPAPAPSPMSAPPPIAPERQEVSGQIEAALDALDERRARLALLQGYVEALEGRAHFDAAAARLRPFVPTFHFSPAKRPQE